MAENNQQAMEQEGQSTLDSQSIDAAEAEQMLGHYKKSVRLRQADLLHQLAEDQRASTAVHNLARLQRMAYAKKVGLSDAEASAAEHELVEDGDMRLGDDDNSIKIENYYAEQPAEPAVQKPEPGPIAAGPTVPEQPSTVSRVAPWLIGAALLGSGLAGGYALSGLMAPDQPSQPGMVDTDTDTDTQYRIDGDFEEMPRK
jgi:hypothetical protein